MKFDNRVIPHHAPTFVMAIRRHGPYTQVEVWANTYRFKLSFDRFLNIISIQRFVKGEHYESWHWRQEFNRGYKRNRSLIPLHVDLVVTALEGAKADRRWTRTKEEK